MERYTRVHEFQDGLFRPVPFNPDVHIDTYEGVDETFYPFKVCYDAVEEALKKDDYALLKTALKAHLGEIGELRSVSLTLIQLGVQQTIFRVEARVQLNGEEREAAFIAGASRQDIVSEMVQTDHEVISRLRESEAEAEATFPRHYGGLKTDHGPFVYLTEFCEGYAELNLHCTADPSFNFHGDTTARRVVINRINQGGPSEFLDRGESSEILSQVALHQVLTALRCKVVISPVFRAGDYMYNPDTQRLMLQCYRTPETAGEPGIWARAHEMIPFPDQDPRLVAVAFQLLRLSASRENNLEHFSKNKPDSQELFFSYSTVDISRVLVHLFEKQLIRPQDFNTIAAIIRYLITGIIPNLRMSQADRAAFLGRAIGVLNLI